LVMGPCFRRDDLLRDVRCVASEARNWLGQWPTWQTKAE
jgi:hypothetical protein